MGSYSQVQALCRLRPKMKQQGCSRFAWYITAIVAGCSETQLASEHTKLALCLVNKDDSQLPPGGTRKDSGRRGYFSQSPAQGAHCKIQNCAFLGSRHRFLASARCCCNRSCMSLKSLW